jgi:hypothetical protein
MKNHNVIFNLLFLYYFSCITVNEIVFIGDYWLSHFIGNFIIWWHTLLPYQYQDIMDYVQGDETLYIPGAMTPTEVNVNF